MRINGSEFGFVNIYKPVLNRKYSISNHELTNSIVTYVKNQKLKL